MNELALFAGAGGSILAGRLLGWRCVCAVEIDPYCREVLLRRQEEEILEPFPIWDDIRTFDGRPWRGKVDVITAGFPCQPFSSAGKRLGDQDDRNLWPETIRVLGEVGPRFALLENVPGLLVQDYFGTILGDLAESGFSARWDCLPAYIVGSPQGRDRLWIVADADGIGGQGREKRDSPRAHGGGWPDDDGLALAQRRAREATSRVRRMDDALAFRNDRLRALGNGWVPQVARRAWELLSAT